MTTVTQEYIEGIKEGRALWRRFRAEGTPELASAALANVEATMRTFSAGPVKDMLRGERDFWRNQLKQGA